MSDSPILEQLKDEGLDEYAFRRVQKEYRKAVVQHGGIQAAATALGVDRKVMSKSLHRLIRSAARQGYAPAQDQTHPVPQGQSIKGVSTLYNSDGEVQAQWVKTKADQEDLREQLREFVSELVDEIPPARPVPSPEVIADSDTLALYPIGDPHLGLYAWAEECGEDFDLDIAVRDMDSAVTALVASTPPAHTAIVLPLGDFLHGDNSNNMTPRSGNILDVDTRYSKVLRTGARLMMSVIRQALGRHGKVIVRVVRGNHDPESSMALALIMDAYFAEEPRVEVDISASAFWYYQFGSVLIGSTHGDTAKIPELGAIMAADRPVEWGSTNHRVWFTGHRHNKQVMELTGGVTVEVARTLTPKDAWHSAKGYRSGRELQSVVFHKTWGEVERHTCSIDRAREAS